MLTYEQPGSSQPKTRKGRGWRKYGVNTSRISGNSLTMTELKAKLS